MPEPQTADKPRFKVTYEAGLPTLVALVISLASLFWQVFNYLQGPSIRLIAPDQLMIGSSERVGFINRDGASYAHFILRMSYVNDGAAGYNATIRRERIKVKVGSSSDFEHRWHRFVTYDSSGSNVKVDKVSDAQPRPLVAGSSESHVTLFQPWPKTCPPADKECDPLESYLTWEDFLELFQRQRTIEIELVSEIYGQRRPASAACRIEMSERAFAEMKEQGWLAPVCNN